MTRQRGKMGEGEKEKEKERASQRKRTETQDRVQTLTAQTEKCNSSLRGVEGASEQ